MSQNEPNGFMFLRVRNGIRGEATGMKKHIQDWVCALCRYNCLCKCDYGILQHLFQFMWAQQLDIKIFLISGQALVWLYIYIFTTDTAVNNQRNSR